MTDRTYTALLLVIDRSGSMISIRDDMVGGLQALLAEQAAHPGMLTVDVVTFDTVVEWTHHFAAPADVRVELEPRGSTALFDALGGAVSHFGSELAKLPEHARPGTVQVVVVTDGEENSSVEWTAQGVRAAVTKQTETFGWDFVFLGANQDAALAARTIGIAADKALDYTAAPDGVAGASQSLSAYVSRLRAAEADGIAYSDIAFSDDERRSARGEQ
ncbi:VWA domain-containing protein [Agromyces sp. MMS24-JH15]|uniref:VWA domain-containing protein n=1 Tax=Agromyces sp. MMS24-JH15 TaxID=3243765 RepID=UPI00374A2F7C